MATNLTLELQDRPGVVAEITAALADANINIEGGCGVTAGGRGTLHLLVNDAAGARAAIEGSGHQIFHEQEVVVVQVEDRPGELAAITKKIADAGANIGLLYLGTNTRLVIGADDLGKVRSAID